MKKLLNWLINSTIVMLLVSLSLLGLCKLGLWLIPDQMPYWTKYHLMVVLSDSMRPAFKTGDVLFVSKSRPNNTYLKGDIISFQDPNDNSKIVTHRVIGVLKSNNQIFYQTKGDANPVSDYIPIPATNVLGQEHFSLPQLGRVFAFAQTNTGMLWMFLVPSLLVIVYEIRTVGKSLQTALQKSDGLLTVKPYPNKD